MNQQIKTRIGIFALASLMMSALAISPSIAEISKTFPKVNLSIIQSLIALPSLTSLIAGFIVSKLATKIQRPKLAIGGLFFIIVGGLFPFFFNTHIEYLLIGAAILGLGIGTLATTNPTIIAENFNLEQRQVVFGQLTAFVNLGGMFLIFTGGMLATIGWKYNYLVFFYPILVLLIAYICLPKQQNVQVKNTNQSANKVNLLTVFKNKNVLIIGLLSFAFMFVFDTFAANISVFIAQEKLGDIKLASMASAVFILSGFISGLLYRYISKLFGFYNIALAFFVLSAGLLITFFSHSILFTIIGSFISGFGLSIYMARTPYILSVIIESIYLPMAITIYTTATAFAAFVSPFIINFIRNTLGYNQVSFSFLIASIIGFVVFILLVTLGLEKKFLSATLSKDSKSLLNMNELKTH
ncbi:MFS transporter [Acinetobacter sp. MB5]|uniref:MFS transporter n=1 Tax=Acinetobacter sp. MB5 TaxID=2069438 RepID=UPI000DD030EF|nr:MFS transporter [Acinetobacter sp. MB5]